MRQKLTLLTFGVQDVQKSAAFYEAIGWKRSEKGTDDLILFDLGGILFSLYPREALAEDIGIPNTTSSFSGIAVSYNANSESEVDAVIAEAVKNGATLVKPAQKVFWGGYSGYIQDLDGHHIEIAFNPFWPLDENGTVVL